MNALDYTNECIRVIKEARIDLQYLSSIGFDISKKSGKCPLTTHIGDNKSGHNFSYKENSDGTYMFNCYSANCTSKSGAEAIDIIDLCMRNENLNTSLEACRYLADKFGIYLPGNVYSLEEKREMAKKKKEAKKEAIIKQEIEEAKKEAIKDGDIEKAFGLNYEKIYGNYKYDYKQDTLFFIKYKENKDGEIEEILIPFYNGDLRIVENSIYLDEDTEMILLSSKMNGKIATKLISKEFLSSNKLADELNKKRGFIISPSNKKYIGEYLFEQYIGMDKDGLLNETLYTKKMGWYENYMNDYNIASFVYPNFNADIKSSVVYCKDEKYNRVFTTRGSFNEWVENILKPSLESENIKILLLSTLSSIFIKPLGVHENFIVDLSGTTGTGKTTAEKVCASVFGYHRNYINDWNATSNSIISKAVELNCFPLMMDDTKKCTSKDMIPGIVYSISGGKSKGRSNVDGTLKQEQEFSNIMITTGEVPITEYLQGSETGRGAFARVITIEGGAFPKNDTNKVIADKLNSATDKYYGTFGIEFINYILSNIDDCIEKWQDEYEAIKEKNSNRVIEELSKRKANHISLLEFTGRRLEDFFGVDLFKTNEIINNLLQRADETSVEADNIKEAYESIIEFCNANRNKFYKVVPKVIAEMSDTQEINNPLGQFKESNEENYFEFYQKEVINNIISKYGDIADIWRAFRERRYIEVNKGTNSFSKTSRCMASNKTKKFFRINVVDTSIGDIIEF